MTNTDYSISSLQKYLPMLRKLYGWTMEQLGGRIGVTKQTISNLEHGNPKMTKVQYIALRSVFETEANERSDEEKENLLKILYLVCDNDEDISEKQRSEALDAAMVVAGATASGVAAASTIKILTGSLASIGLIAAVPTALPVVATLATGSWLTKMLREKNNEERKKKE